MADDVKAAPASAKAAPKIDAQKVEREVSWLGARLREKSTYAGLTVLVSLLLPSLAHSSDIVNYISMIGMGIGGLLAIFLPEAKSKAVLAFFLIAAAAATLALPSPAMAASRVAVRAAPASATPTFADAIQQLLTKLQGINSDVITNTVSALKAADADAGAVITPATSTTDVVVKDPISHACYPALIKYLQALPAAQTTSVPAPYNLIVLFQYKRDFVNLLLTGQLVPSYLKLGCAALLGSEAEIFAGALGMVGVGAAALNPITAFATSLGAAAITLPAL